MSPILGIYASQISGHLFNFPASSYESIATGTGTGSSDSITFTSIPAGYTHLQIRGMATVNYGATDFGTIGVRFNGDTGNNYTRHYLRGFKSGGVDYLQAGAVASTNFAQAGTAFLRISQSIGGANVIDILDYNSTNKYKTIRALSGAEWNTGGATEFNSGAWMSTSSVTSVTVFAQNGNFGTETTFALYGIKVA